MILQGLSRLQVWTHDGLGSGDHHRGELWCRLVLEKLDGSPKAQDSRKTGTMTRT